MDEERILGESDWEDQDLLTVDEALYRLEHEVRASTARVRELESGDVIDESSLARERGRLQRLTERWSQVAVLEKK